MKRQEPDRDLDGLMPSRVALSMGLFLDEQDEGPCQMESQVGRLECPRPRGLPLPRAISPLA